MKKIISLLLCVVMCFMLASCDEDVIGKELGDLKDKYTPEEREEVVLDFYIIVGEGTQSNAIITTERMINSYLSDKFSTTLDIHYVTAEEYEAEVTTAVNATGDDRADIVLVVGKDMFDSLHGNKNLANITDYFKGSQFGRLNTIINKNLLSASVVEEDRITTSGSAYVSHRNYIVPNNHVIGEYKYFLINKAEAQYYNECSEVKIQAMTSFDNEYVKTLISKMEADGKDYTQFIKEVSGPYEMKAQMEAEGYYCNVSVYPQATKEEAFSSGFAVVRAENDHTLDSNRDVKLSIEEEAKLDKTYLDHYERCMEVIYTINSDAYLRNLLQYGVEGTSYSIDENGVVTPYLEGTGVYNMDMLHTGDVFGAYFNTIGWTEEAAGNGIKQNEQSVIGE